MEEFVAVRPIEDFLISALQSFANSFYEPHTPILITEPIDSVYSRLLSSVKQEAFLFDKIYVVVSNLGNPSKELLTEVEWLIEENILTIVDQTSVIDALNSELDSPKSGLDKKEIFKSAVRGWGTEYQKINHVENRKLLNEYEKSIAALGKRYDKPLSDLEKYLTLLTEQPSDLKLMRQYQARALKGAKQIRELKEALGNAYRVSVSQVEKALYPTNELLTRLYALHLEHFKEVMATPLLAYSSYIKIIAQSNVSNVAQIVIHDLPLPHPNTPWEKITEYRENEDNRKNLLALRRWIRKISSENLSAAECKQELDWLKYEFQSHLKLHQIKANAQTLEAIIKAPLEILENLVTMKFSKLIDPLFAVKKRQISLMEAELNAPGREIAYLINSKESFE